MATADMNCPDGTVSIENSQQDRGGTPTEHSRRLLSESLERADATITPKAALSNALRPYRHFVRIAPSDVLGIAASESASSPDYTWVPDLIRVTSAAIPTASELEGAGAGDEFVASRTQLSAAQEAARQGAQVWIGVWVGGRLQKGRPALLVFVEQTADGKLWWYGACNELTAEMNANPNASAAWSALVDADHQAAVEALGDQREDQIRRDGIGGTVPLGDGPIQDAPLELQAGLQPYLLTVRVPEDWMDQAWLLCTHVEGVGWNPCSQLRRKPDPRNANGEVAIPILASQGRGLELAVRTDTDSSRRTTVTLGTLALDQRSGNEIHSELVPIEGGANLERVKAVDPQKGPPLMRQN